MNDAEIIKALEYCVSHKECADDCPCVIAEKPCVINDPIKLLNLIKRQQAEIEGLQFDISELSKRIITLTDEKIRIASQRDEYLHRLALGVARDNKPIVITYSELTNNVLSIACNNAIKEFAQKLKNKSELMALSVYAKPERAVFIDDIDNLVEQMTGGET